jgi:hypothetical protein
LCCAVHVMNGLMSYQPAPPALVCAGGDFFESGLIGPARSNPSWHLTAAPLPRSTVAEVRTRVVRSTVPARGCGSAWVR